jgi:hypothetical protein
MICSNTFGKEHLFRPTGSRSDSSRSENALEHCKGAGGSQYELLKERRIQINTMSGPGELSMRQATVERHTKETRISASVFLDGQGKYDVSNSAHF